jgi:hypothetical protein
MPERDLIAGPNGQVVLWAPTKETLERSFPGCPKAAQADRVKVMRIAKEFALTGRFRKNDEKFKKIEGEKYLHEIKGHQIRMLGFFHGTKFVVVLCVIKKKDKHSRDDLSKANKLRESYHAQA